MLNRRDFMKLAGLSVLAAACRRVGTESPTPSGPQEPAREWDHDFLAELLVLAASNETSAFLVVDRGDTILTWTDGSDPGHRDVASVQKSVTSILIGIALADGVLDLDDPVTRHMGAGWSSSRTEDRITIRHLLTMTSGLNRQLRNVSEPGSKWDYNNVAYHQLHWVLESATGMQLEALSQDRLFTPLGIDGAQWEQRGLLGRQADPKGNPMLGLVMSAHELAKVGQLVLQQGHWAGSRIVPAAYIADSTAPSQELNPSYGYLWWVNGQRAHRLPTGSALRDGPLIPDAPPDLVAAMGAGDQRLYVWPEREIVVVRLGEDAGPDFDGELWRLLLEAAP